MQTGVSIPENYKPVYSIDGIEYELDKAAIIAKVIEVDGENDDVMQYRFYWAIDIYAKENEEGYDPKFSFKMLEQTSKFEYNKHFVWDKASAYDKKSDSWLGSFYIYDGHYFECSLNLTRLDKLHFLVKVNGRVNINHEIAPAPNYKTFHIEQVVAFYGIRADYDTEGIVRAVASVYMDTDGMIWEQDGNYFWLDYPRKA